MPALAELATTGSAEARLLRPTAISGTCAGCTRVPASPWLPEPARFSRWSGPVTACGRLQHVLARPQPWVVVLGDSCADFCFALACDRLLGGATWLPSSRLPEDVLGAAVAGLSRDVSAVSAVAAMPMPVTSVSLDTAAVAEARRQFGERGLLAFTDARTVVISPGTLSFDHPARLGDPSHVHLAESSPVHREPADGSLHVAPPC